MSENQDILPILWRRRVAIILSAIVAMVLTAVVMLLKPNYYQSTAVFYPVSEALQKPILDANDNNLSLFGNDHDIDRLLSITRSNEIKNGLIKELNLSTHYEIDMSSPKAQVKLHKKLNKLYDSQKTQFDGIEISFEDTDPEKAQQFVSTALSLIENKARSLSENARNQLVMNMTNEVQQKKQELDSLTATIKGYKEKYGIYDTNSQGEALASLEAKSPSSNAIKRKISEYTKGASLVKQLETQQTELSKIVTYDKNQLNKLIVSQSADISAIHIIEPPHLPIDKSRPKRSIYVLVAGIMTGLMASLLSLFHAYAEQVSWT